MEHVYPIEALKKLYGDPRNREQFKKRSERVYIVNENGERERDYSSLETGDCWEAMEELITARAFVTTLIVYSDQTEKSRTKAIGWPVFMSLGNIYVEDKRKRHGHVLLGLLLVLKQGAREGRQAFK